MQLLVGLGNEKFKYPSYVITSTSPFIVNFVFFLFAEKIVFVWPFTDSGCT